jgi:exonuclease III
VRDLVADHHCDLICLQETKLQVVDELVITSTLGQDFSQHYAMLLTVGMRGGVLLTCSQCHYTMSQVTIRSYSVTTTINRIVDGATWTVIRVYGPQEDTNKLLFLQELRQIKQIASKCWILVGDFNLIYRASDKSTDRVN